MRRRLIAAALIAGLAAADTTAFAAQQSYLTIQGKNQGTMKGRTDPGAKCGPKPVKPGAWQCVMTWMWVYKGAPARR